MGKVGNDIIMFSGVVEKNDTLGAVLKGLRLQPEKAQAQQRALG